MSEVLVVDNASADCTRDEVAARGIRLIANPTNAGFAAAVNQGVRATTAPLILLLNPDAHLVRGLDALAALSRNARNGRRGRNADRRGRQSADAVSWREICRLRQL